MSLARFSLKPHLLTLAISLGLALSLSLPLTTSADAPPASQGSYLQTNLVSDISGMAKFTDPLLKNPWGLAASPTGPFWAADNATGVATVYNGDGSPFPSSKMPLVVTIPPPQNMPDATAAPTGEVFNGTDSFKVSQNGVTAPALFIFDTEDGTISGWNPKVNGTNAILKVDNSPAGAVYKGLAISSTNAGNFIYATNFSAGVVEEYDKNFQPVRTFTDEQLSTDCPFEGQCFAPFGIRNIDSKLYVTYALQKPGKHDDMAGPGNGFVDIFDLNGNLLRRFAAGGTLNSPWGLALAPGNFGQFSHDLLVGNFGDGRINAFNLQSGAFLGQVSDANGNPITIDDLWSLSFGNGHLAGPTNTLFFTAGINDEMDGLFGTLTALS